MAAGTVAAVYAQALLELADERGKRREIVEDCWELSLALGQNPALLSQLDDPRLGKDKAKELLRQALGGKLQQEVFDLLRLLVDRNRLRDVAAIVAEAVRRAEEKAGVLHVTATTVAALDLAAHERLLGALKRALGSGVVLHTATDANLIGGITLLVGDLFVDGSVSRQLAEMKTLILHAPLDGRIWEGDAA